ncbi:hypothetical protein ABB37_04238 [Leptomonas pyrrhocoris]|uniref:Uncharacterized protein n=1 Tax=Leptomonas pyrrhocoris TaxID=157538 RepID=A0A0M9G2G9_LEPPY|nr:hypothetical protein ABB37_04238 [Leptomonas pyrrhocoris]XP_015659238.1 hypothetical protein ABB37_04238 [Leptomonas pyrrhocoris]KPA80798.1 hypothetical protein ABB37_04238 [Leptomonas pyrrhocoris]KPA80799.1 hypothetical protein ABB37_04238 [Leptomonas pyrrhocoris]|eukprot:XP_015659237.1 hypothetical protein ABB37_04238 [Leptomonas pyrrhocoris]
MPSDRDTAGETFDNTYHNTTLVGNWYEDRLLRSEQPQRSQNGRHISKAACEDGLLEDLRITQARNAPQVRQDLMHTTYDVDYNRTAVGVDAEDTVSSSKAPVPLLGLLPGTSTRGAACSIDHGSPSGREGVDRALLFSQDPVADPLAELPLSTNTDTYGAFFFLQDGSGGAEGDGEGDAKMSTDNTQAGQTRSRRQRNDEYCLYDSVTNAKTRLATGGGGGGAGASVGGKSLSTKSVQNRGATSAAAAAASTSSAIQRRTFGFTSLAAPAAEASGGDTAVRTTTTTVASGRGMQSRSGKQKGGRNDTDEDDVRWCTSKQAADIPVEHCVFQRRLPPVWM